MVEDQLEALEEILKLNPGRNVPRPVRWKMVRETVESLELETSIVSKAIGKAIDDTLRGVESGLLERFGCTDPGGDRIGRALADRDLRMRAAGREEAAKLVELLDGGRDASMDGFSAGGIADAIRQVLPK